jgi:D-tyrosyl-tRNA(Tyr) deacylase
MRAVIQRVTYAKVIVDGQITGQIQKGLMVLIGMQLSDDEKVMEYMLNKIINMRIFEDNNDKMNLSLLDVEGQLLIVPNFTLYGDGRKGNRPSYSSASTPETARLQFEQFVRMAKNTNIVIQTGKFQADMKVELVNDGPITLLLDSDKNF